MGMNGRNIRGQQRAMFSKFKQGDIVRFRTSVKPLLIVQSSRTESIGGRKVRFLTVKNIAEEDVRPAKVR